MSARLTSALQEAEREMVGAQGAGWARGHRSAEHWAVQEAIRTAALEAGIWSHDIGLVLGRSVGHSTDPPARVGALASADADP
ncbi:MAG TPA: hypothetical protein VE650_03240, partial [Acetobacteraceae bacterium]|nr:hypothetical protein [Acetobacteraceae bacterium]